MAGIFVSGGTGYLGRELIGALLGRGHQVRALARAGSLGKLPSGCTAVTGNALAPEGYARHLRAGDTLVHLVGVSHPSPWKADEFRRVDLASVQAAAPAAAAAGVGHFVYVSVAHPAPVMRAYIAARTQCESVIRESGLRATIVRPWYVLGPGHRWPYALAPIYWLLERLPSTRESARRLGLVTRAQMVRVLVEAVENPPAGLRIVEVPEIRKGLGAGREADAALAS
jgi:uncharacterized protein YbjT (DUF2867 family)